MCSKGGLYIRKMDIRRVELNDSESRFGVFANDTVSNKKIIIKYPTDIFTTTTPK